MIDVVKAIWISFFMSILSGVVICFCFYFFIMPNLPPPATWGIKKGEQKIEVPNFVGVHPNQAKITAEEKGLLIVIAGEEENENFPEGIIVRQTPLPGSFLPPGGAINVYIAKKEKKEEMVRVPFVKGLSLAIAQNQITNAGLTIEKIENINSDSIPKGHVIKTLPPEGSNVSKNTPITIFVSSGANLVVVPNLIGKYFPSALTLLEERGLDAGKVKRVLSTEHPENMIIDQSPRPGEKVPKGSKVNIVVATVEEEIKY